MMGIVIAFILGSTFGSILIVLLGAQLGAAVGVLAMCLFINRK